MSHTELASSKARLARRASSFGIASTVSSTVEQSVASAGDDDDALVSAAAAGGAATTTASSEQRPRKRAKRERLQRCPSCGVNVPYSEVDAHYRFELGRILAGSSAPPTPSAAGGDGTVSTVSRRSAAVNARRKLHSSLKKSSSRAGSSPEWQSRAELEKRDRATLDQVMANRERRAASQLDLIPGLDSEADAAFAAIANGEQTCPLCHQQLFGDLEAVNAHIDSCLNMPSDAAMPNTASAAATTPSVGVAAVEASTAAAAAAEAGAANGLHVGSGPPSPQVETYSWGGQQRVRTASLVPGGLASLGYQVVRKQAEDEDIDVDVDDDSDMDAMGAAQFSEHDLVRPAADDDTQAVVSNEDDAAVATSAAFLPPSSSSSSFSSSAAVPSGGNDDAHVIAVLKQSLLDLRAKQPIRCMVCLDTYTDPCASVKCWHVHCKQCWLQTLGSKRLCPQCTAITGPGDLRRVYL